MYVQIPREYLQALVRLNDPTASLVGLAIAEETYAWHRTCQPVSLTRLTMLTGLTRSAIARALGVLVSRGLLQRGRIGPKGTVLTPIPPRGTRLADHFGCPPTLTSYAGQPDWPARVDSQDGQPGWPIEVASQNGQSSWPTEVDSQTSQFGGPKEIYPMVTDSSLSSDVSHTDSASAPESAEAPLTRGTEEERQDERDGSPDDPMPLNTPLTWKRRVGALFRGKQLNWQHLARMYRLAQEHGIDLVALAEEVARTKDLSDPTSYLHACLQRRIRAQDGWLVAETDDAYAARRRRELAQDAAAPMEV